MCGRYTFYDIDEAEKHFYVAFPSDVKPCYNLAPTHTMPVNSK